MRYEGYTTLNGLDVIDNTVIQLNVRQTRNGDVNLFDARFHNPNGDPLNAGIGRVRKRILNAFKNHVIEDAGIDTCTDSISVIRDKMEKTYGDSINTKFHNFVEDYWDKNKDEMVKALLLYMPGPNSR